MSALLPCPFCGGAAELSGHRRDPWVRCRNCGATAEAVEEWNRRTPEENAGDVVEALKKAEYAIDRLKAVHAGKVVRDLDEALEAFDAALASLNKGNAL